MLSVALCVCVHPVPQHANKVMPELKPKLLALHAKVAGAADKLYAWFLDLLPAEAKDR